ncbi:MAG TPA: helix-turn-helix domain-containing protein [Beijerinckia sp.]|nr:helix-turn-helix domain-containing protein [Beijerinckia sp.]
MIEDGENPDDVSARFEPSIKSLRMMLGIEQESFSRLIQVPLATLAEWEEGRAEIDPATRLLIKLIAKDPSAIVRMLIELAIADPMIVSN